MKKLGLAKPEAMGGESTPESLGAMWLTGEGEGGEDVAASTYRDILSGTGDGRVWRTGFIA